MNKQEIVEKAAKEGVEHGWLNKNTNAVVCGWDDGFNKKVLVYDNIDSYIEAFEYHIKKVYPPLMTGYICASEIYEFMYSDEFKKRRESFKKIKAILNKVKGSRGKNDDNG